MISSQTYSVQQCCDEFNFVPLLYELIVIEWV